mgnify:CR=1 FL=1
MIALYQEDGIIAEPAGALSICGLDYLDTDKIVNKKVVCILSGGNNDMLRYPEILDKNMRYLKLKHYFIINFICIRSNNIECISSKRINFFIRRTTIIIRIGC